MEWYICISVSMIFIMNKPCVIVIEYATRELLKEVAKKSQTYDHIINELIGLKEKDKDEKVVHS
jgi:hypothetical protein